MSKYHTPALDKGLDIIEYLSMKAIPQSQAEISNGINKNPNEIYRMLVCLEQRGYLTKDKVSGNFSLSLKLYHLSHRHTPVDELLKSSKPIMESLSHDTKQSCHMGILYDGQLMIVSQTRSPGPVSLSIEEGALFPLAQTTSGKVVLAFLNEELRTIQLNKNKEFKAFSAAKKKSFIARLEKIRQRGYEIMESEITMGVKDIAVPIGNIQTGVFGVLAISSLSNVTQIDNFFEILTQKILKASQEINTAIGLMETKLPTKD